MIDFNCPKCGEALSVPGSQAGKTETCPACGNVTIVGASLKRIRVIYRIVGVFAIATLALISGWLIGHQPTSAPPSAVSNPSSREEFDKALAEFRSEMGLAAERSGKVLWGRAMIHLNLSNTQFGPLSVHQRWTELYKISKANPVRIYQWSSFIEFIDEGEVQLTWPCLIFTHSSPQRWALFPQWRMKLSEGKWVTANEAAVALVTGKLAEAIREKGADGAKQFDIYWGD